MELISQIKSLEDIVARHDQLIGKEARNLRAEYSISSSKETQDEIRKIENDNRLLQIGIVGRVKAGKSSLLNALLFDGKSVLPKAATPMTAALTVVSYGEALSAEIEFYSPEDIDNIRMSASRYEEEFEQLLQKKEQEAKERAKKRAERSNVSGQQEAAPQKSRDVPEKNVTRELEKAEPVLSASHDQYKRMCASGIDSASLEDSKVIPFNTLEDLTRDLVDYVGADGHYMPFTKSVHIRLPQENLKNIQIVDTPGMNDPVVSREERTRALLKFCDVVFIVSPAGQFMSSEDLELMDRITSKEGIQELFVVASKCDSQLFGNLMRDSNGDLHLAFKAMSADLADSLHSTLSNLKESNPEVGSVYDKLIDQSRESIIHSSGISHTIKEAYDNPSALDSGEAHAWNMLLENYPDYFSKADKKLSASNLDLLSNMDVINKVVNDVRDQKNAILSRRKEEFVRTKTSAFERYRNQLLQSIEQSVEELKDGDIDELKERRNKLNHIQSSVSDLVDEEYYDLVVELKSALSHKLKSELNSYFKDAKRDMDGAERTQTETYEVSTASWRNLWLGGSEARTRTYKSVRTGAVRSALSDLTIEIESSIENVSNINILTWRKSLTSALLNVLREHIDDEDLNPAQIRKVLRHVVQQINFPNLSYQDDLALDESTEEPKRNGIYGFALFNQESSSLKDATGTLTGSSADSFVDEAQEYLSSLKKKVRKDIDSYMDKLISNLQALVLSKEIFIEYNNQLEELARQIENREMTLDEYKLLTQAIEAMK